VGSREDFWLRLISKGPLQVPATEDPLFLDALNRLRVSRIKPEHFKSMEASMSSDHHVYDAIMADMWLKGEAKTISVFEKLGVSPETIAKAKAMLAKEDSETEK
jgi:hypothetical protein